MDKNNQKKIISINEREKQKVSISDSTIKKIVCKKERMQIFFDKYGFWAWHSNTEQYCRVKNAKIELLGCNLENFDIFVLKPKKIFRKIILYKKYIDVHELIKNINSGIWNLTIIQEFHCVGGGFMIGRIDTGKIRMDCYIDLCYELEKYEYSESMQN